MLIIPLKHILHAHRQGDLTGCRSTDWSDQQTRPAAAGAAKTWQLSSIATPWTLSSSQTIPSEFQLRSFTAGGLVVYPCVCVCVCVINVWLPARDGACVKRVGELETPFFFILCANCIGDDIVASAHFSGQWGEVTLLSHRLCPLRCGCRTVQLRHGPHKLPAFWHWTSSTKTGEGTTPWT